MSAEYLLTSSIEPPKRGELYADWCLPPHVTIHQWFSLELQGPFRNALQNLATEHGPIDVIGDTEALYGPDKDIPVRLLRNIGKLARLHAMTGELIDRFDGVRRNPEWSGEGYSPHVTYANGIAPAEGEIVTLRSLELISREAEATHSRVELVLPLVKR